MANKNGQVYGLTILSPIKEDPNPDPSDETALRIYLAGLPNGPNSPFAKVSTTHLCRLVVLDDVVFVGDPAKEEHLKSAYLMFTSNFDGDLDAYLQLMVKHIGNVVDEVWKHCAGYPGIQDLGAFITYMKRCLITTTFFFADVNNKTVEQTLRALQVQRAVTVFVEASQGMPPAKLQAAFLKFQQYLQRLALPAPGSCPALCDEERAIRAALSDP